MQHSINSDDRDFKNNKIDLYHTFRKYLYHWKLFLLGVIIALSLALVYLKFATYKYEVSSTILINNAEDDGGSTSEFLIFQDLGLTAGPKTSLDTEIGILKSKSLIESVIKDLGLHISYYVKDEITFKEVYKDEMPLNIHFLDTSSKLGNLNTTITIKPLSNSKFVIFNGKQEKTVNAVFGEKVTCDLGEIIVTTNLENVNKIEEFLIKIVPLEETAIAYQSRIKFYTESRKTNILTLTLKDPIKTRAMDVLDSLVSYYNKEAIEYKTQITTNTNEFINTRIDDIFVELTGLDQGVEAYKVDNQLSNMDSEANLVLASNASLSNRIVELSSQIKLIDFVTNYLKTNTNDLIPSNLGLLNDNTNENTIKYNNLLLEKNRLLKGGANNQNPVVISLNDEIASLRQSIDRSLVNNRSSLVISLNDLKQQEYKLNSKISAAPKKEREIRNIQRQQEIIETLYLYLLEKREENSIYSAITAPYAKIIDKAYGSNITISPNKLQIFALALFLGLLLPFIYIYTQLIFEPKIFTLDDIEDIFKAPMLGNISKLKSKKSIIDLNQKRKSIYESFRLLRINSSHLLPKSNKVGQTIFITSTVKREGKTFIALNLASSFKQLNKRVLVIDADFRNFKSSISANLNVKNEGGLINYLEEGELQLPNLITYDEKTNLDILRSGILPSNTFELLSNNRFEEVLAYAKSNYDYIIVDTSSVNTTADPLLFGDYADLFIYVVRANYLNKHMLKIPKKLYETNQLENMAIVLNSSISDLAYGYN